MPHLSDAADAMRPSVFADLEPHIARFTKAGGELLPLHIGDTMLAPPAGARLALAVKDDDPGLYRYGPTGGWAPLCERIGARVVARGRAFAGFEPEANLLLAGGATHALFCAARAVLRAGDEVLLASPYWPLAHGVLGACGARVVEVPTEKGGVRMSPAEAFARVRTDKTRAIYVISPNNPDGRVLTAEEGAQIARLATEHDLWVFADEVYAEFAYDAPHVPLATLEGMAARTITASSFSKSHALAGLRIGYVTAPREVVRVARRVSTHTLFNVPMAVQRAAFAALAVAAGEKEAFARYRAARDRAARELTDAGFRFAWPTGGTYAFLDFTEALAGRPLAALLARAIDAGVLLAPGDGFGADFATHARLCFTATEPDKLSQGIARLATAVRAF
jgi:aspartate/methionine/tyrosine aminotransferase